MRKSKKAPAQVPVFTEEQRELVRQCGAVSFPVLDMCRLLGVSIDAFSASDELMDIYRNAQLATGLEIRLRLLASIKSTGDVKVVKLFLEQFAGAILPDPRDMEEAG